MMRTCTPLSLPRFLVGLLLAAGSCLADSFPDDHGDTVAEGATSIAFGATTAGSVEIDIDRDLFSFTAEEGYQYRIEVTPGTLKDVDVKLRASDQLTGLALRRDSVGQSGLDFWYPHVIPTTTLYLDLGGFAAYTVGSYTVKITRSVTVDTEPDGLPDLWENEVFNTLSKLPGDDEDGDGFTNLQELLLGSDPNDAGSGLFITDLQLGDKHITWQSSTLRNYELSAGPSLDGASWTPIATVPGSASSTTYPDSSAGGPERRFYRVRMVQ